jgi:regulator of nucleoside diphosphate kinase
MTQNTQETLPRIRVCTSDHARLSSLLDTYDGGRDSELLEQLDMELARSEVVEKLPPDVVGMNSMVVFRDLDSGEERKYQLVYPREADPGHGRVSILAPVGCALLGLSVGQKITWPLPDGRSRNLEVIAVSLPPAAGEQ